MSNIYIVGDPHFKDRVSSRLDNYGYSILDKLKFITNISSKVSTLIFLGDLYDSVEYTDKVGSVSKRAVSLRLESAIREVLDGFISREGRVLSLIGNHDVIGDDISTIRQTGLGLNPSVELFNSDSESSLLFDCILGINAYEDFKQKDWNSRVKYLLIHGFIDISRHDVSELFYSVSKAKEYYPNLKGIFAGHDHQVRDIENINGVNIYRSGSLGRISSDKDGMNNRKIYLIKDINTEREVIEEVIIPSKPYSEVFMSKDITKVSELSSKKFIEGVINNSGSNIGILDMLESVDDDTVKHKVIQLLRDQGIEL